VQVIVCESPDESARLVAAEILRELAAKPDLVLGLATGSTPVGVYNELIRAHRELGVDFSKVRTFNLDEYLGLPPEHPQSYRYFMREHLFDHIDLEPDNIHFPPTAETEPQSADLPERFEAHEQLIRDCGGIDIQLLGIGSNGHIGFNEPTSSLASRTRVKTLTDKTLLDNSRFYDEGEQQPHLAVTLGIATILDARRIFLQAFGEHKAEAIRQCVEGPISSFWPATVLQTHRRVTAFVDEGSASLLQMVDYYRRARDEEKRLIEEGLWP
jgi:glucosamine-6-phosphate deaminase